MSKLKLENLKPELLVLLDQMVEDAFGLGEFGQIDLSCEVPEYGGFVKAKIVVIPIVSPNTQLERTDLSGDPDPTAN